MPRMTRSTMLRERRCGLKYYDQAVAQTSHQALIDKAIGYVQQHPGVWGTGWANFAWAFGNAVIGTILPNKDISQTYNLSDVLSETDIAYIQSKLPQMAGFPPDIWPRK